jgi:GT2 family glycosyltransferase
LPADLPLWRSPPLCLDIDTEVAWLASIAPFLAGLGRPPSPTRVVLGEARTASAVRALRLAPKLFPHGRTTEQRMLRFVRRPSQARRRARPNDPSSGAGRWDAFIAEVEPSLTCVPRAHRLGVPPLIGDASVRPAPIAVWIEEPPNGAGGVVADARSRTLTSLNRGSMPPSHIITGDLQEALAGHRADHVLLMRAGDEASPLAIERLGQAVTLAPDARLITCDEDRLTPAGGRSDPRVRPGPSPDHWLACDASGSMFVVCSQPAAGAAMDLGENPAWRHQLALELAGGDGRGHAHVPMFLCHRGASDPESARLTATAVTRAMQRFGQRGEADASPDGYRRIRRPVDGEPKVEAVICFRDRPELLRRCVRSLLDVTAYDRLHVALVDNGSAEPETASLVRELGEDARVRLVRQDQPFNFAALNNAAARASDADVLLFLNNDTESIEPGWLLTLLGEAVRPEVGAVAPLLLYPSGRVQHAGAAVGLHGYAGHPFAGLWPQAATPFGIARAGTRNWLAVTAACLMVERWKFESVGGFDETFVVAGNDVDLCLRLTAAGHRSLCVTESVMIHDESQSRGQHIDPGDFAASERSYGDFRTIGDPFYSPNLTLSRADCSIRGPEDPVR